MCMTSRDQVPLMANQTVVLEDPAIIDSTNPSGHGLSTAPQEPMG
jgi:hypothetical protein